MARWIGLTAVVLAVTLVAVWSVGVRAMRMQTAATASDNDQLTRAQPGAHVKGVFKRTTADDGTPEALLPNQQS